MKLPEIFTISTNSIKSSFTASKSYCARSRKPNVLSIYQLTNLSKTFFSATDFQVLKVCIKAVGTSPLGPVFTTGQLLLAVGAEHVGVVVSGVFAARQVEGHVEEDDYGEEHAQDKSGCLLLFDQF